MNFPPVCFAFISGALWSILYVSTYVKMKGRGEQYLFIFLFSTSLYKFCIHLRYLGTNAVSFKKILSAHSSLLVNHSSHLLNMSYPHFFFPDFQLFFFWLAYCLNLSLQNIFPTVCFRPSSFLPHNQAGLQNFRLHSSCHTPVNHPKNRTCTLWKSHWFLISPNILSRT